MLGVRHPAPYRGQTSFQVFGLCQSLDIRIVFWFAYLAPRCRKNLDLEDVRTKRLVLYIMQPNCTGCEHALIIGYLLNNRFAKIVG